MEKKWEKATRLSDRKTYKERQHLEDLSADRKINIKTDRIEMSREEMD
jgi:hypothetical protein